MTRLAKHIVFAATLVASCGSPAATRPPVASTPSEPAADEPRADESVADGDESGGGVSYTDAPTWRFDGDGNVFVHATVSEMRGLELVRLQHHQVADRWVTWSLESAPEASDIEAMTGPVTLRMDGAQACEGGRTLARRLEAREQVYGLSLRGEWTSEQLECLSELHPETVFVYDAGPRRYVLTRAPWREALVGFASATLTPSEAESLASLRSLRVLGVTRTVDEATLTAIAALPLRSLVVGGLESSTPLRFMRQLRRLSVHGGSTLDLRALRPLSELRELDLERVPLGAGAWVALEPLVGLRHVRLRMTGLRNVTCLECMHQLQTLDVSANQELTSLEGVRSAELRYLRAARSGLGPGSLEPLRGCGALEELDLADTEVDSSTLRALSGLEHLRRLNLSETPVDDAGLEHLRGLRSLESLNLFGAHDVTGVGFAHLRGLGALRRLSFGATQVGAEGLRERMQLTQLDQQLLSLGYLRVGGGLDALRGNTAVRELVLWGTDTDDAALEHIAGLTQLTFLSLGRTRITDAGLEHLAGLTHLVRLRLNTTAIEGAGFVHLAGMQELEQLELYETHVDDEGLARLPVLASLETLALGQTRITDEAIGQLAAQPRLRSLTLNETRITDEAIDAILALPALEECGVGGSTTLADGTEITSAMTPQGRARLRQALEARAAR